MASIENFPDYKVPGFVEHQFNPYEYNGGSIVGIGGKDFAVVGSDMRLSCGYNIFSREHSKLKKLTSKTVLASCGNWCDTDALTGLLEAQVKRYSHSHEDKEISLNALAQMLSTIMYGRRFFPYYVSNILAGVDENGEGFVYSYDPIGHMEKHKYRAGGSSSALLQPVLDNQVGLKNMEIKQDTPLTKERAVDLITDTFVSAAERDIYTGDGVLINIITKDGIETKRVELRKD